MSGERSEEIEDEEGGDGELEDADANDLPTKARREAEDELMETPAAP